MRYLISNGDLNVPTYMMVVDIGTRDARFASLDDAVIEFVNETGLPNADEVVVNPVGEPGDV